MALPGGSSDSPTYASEALTIDQALGPGRRRLRQRLKSELFIVQQIWNQTAEALGLEQAIADEDSAFLAAQEALQAVLTTPATTLAGVRAKLTIFIATRGPGLEDCETFFRTLLYDLRHLEA